MKYHENLTGRFFFADPPFYFVLNNFSYSVIINAEDFDQTLSAFQLNCVKSLRGQGAQRLNRKNKDERF